MTEFMQHRLEPVRLARFTLLALAGVLSGLGLLWAGLSALAGRGVSSPRIFQRAYPEAVRKIVFTRDGWRLIMADGQWLNFSDREQSSRTERLRAPDIRSMLVQAYPYGRRSLPMPRGQEPGRVRYYPLFKAIYGENEAAVEANLEVVDFFGLRLRFNRRHGAADALRAVVRDIEGRAALRGYMQVLAAMRAPGTPMIRDRFSNTGAYVTAFNWRPIEGTERLSAHSFGVAIDIINPFSQRPPYWEWVKEKAGPEPRRMGLARYQPFPHAFEKIGEIDQPPWELIEVFERHGFIWGGKWHHFDTMHFEYRPEFLAMSSLKSRSLKKFLLQRQPNLPKIQTPSGKPSKRAVSSAG